MKHNGFNYTSGKWIQEGNKIKLLSKDLSIVFKEIEVEE